jgi:hypothetical protein
MKLLSIVLAFVGAGALACPADDAMEAQAPAQDKAVVEAKAQPRAAATPAAKPAASTKKAQQTTKVADKSAVDSARKSPL